MINYNTAEITFTPKRLITKDRRIQVEFEYADRNFLNSQIYVNNEMNFKDKLFVNIGAYSNLDAKNSIINQPLDDKQKQFLADIGDGIDNAYYVNAVSDTFSPARYCTKKSIRFTMAGIHDSIFVSLPIHPMIFCIACHLHTSALAREITGSYWNAANGKVFQWVQPEPNNEKQGDWEPGTFLVTPKKQQVVTRWVLNYAFSATTKTQTEVAMSNYDVNLFSTKDKANDTGFAGKFQFTERG